MPCKRAYSILEGLVELTWMCPPVIVMSREALMISAGGTSGYAWGIESPGYQRRGERSPCAVGLIQYSSASAQVGSTPVRFQVVLGVPWMSKTPSPPTHMPQSLAN